MKQHKRNEGTELIPQNLPYKVKVVNASGEPVSTVMCHTLFQCREVVRIESPIHGAHALYFISWNGEDLERWTLSSANRLHKIGYRGN